ncbi:1,4-dihydroxy-2-naphthoate polyprenyltransferase [Paenibacillus sp. CMAA1364]
MTLKSFLSLVEIKTKLASMIPFFLGSVYVVFRFEQFQIANFILMFISLLTFDLFTTAMNNYYDFKKAQKREGYGYQEHNAIVKFGLKESTVVTVIITLFVTAVSTGMWLVFHTGIVIFLVGGLSFCVGILYSFGPIPISRMPLGELFSGLFMGFVIIFVSTYIHVGDRLVLLTLEYPFVRLDINILEVILIFLISIPAILGISNIMLANNICDMEEDVENKRYTLPVYIGKEYALILFRYIYYVSFVDMFVLIFLGVSPWIVLLIVITFIPLKKNIALFMKRQTKKHTFGLAVQNFLMMNMARIVILGIAIVMAK